MKKLLTIILTAVIILTSCGNKSADTPDSPSDTPTLQIDGDITSNETSEASLAVSSEPTPPSNTETVTTTVAETTTSATTKSSSNKKEPTATEEPDVTEYVPDEPDISIIYGSGNGYDDDNVPSAGEAYISNELERALKEYGSSSSVRYAIYIDVYSADDNDTIDLFLEEYTVNGKNYEDVCNQRDIIIEEINRLRGVSDNVIHTELTAAEIDEYQRQINDLEKHDAELCEISMDMLYEAEQYMLKTESDKLSKMGLSVYGITHNKRSSNYILAIVSANEIKALPGDRGVGYKIGLTSE